MPWLSRLIIKTALCYLVAGFGAGALLLINTFVPLHPGIGALRPIHFEWVLVGWMVQFAIGVAYWILPRFGGLRPNSALVWGSFALLNAGLAISTISAVIGPTGLVLTAARTAQFAGIAAFILHIAPRIKPPRGHLG